MKRFSNLILVLILVAIGIYISGYLGLRATGEMAIVGYDTDEPILRTDIPYAFGETLDNIYLPMLYLERISDPSHIHLSSN
jgi:hypothetical protein